MKTRRHGKKKAGREGRKQQRLGLAVAISAIVVVAVVLGYTFLLPAQSILLGPGAVAPDFELPMIDAQGMLKEKVSLSSLRGKVVFLEFMVSWCKGCQEMAEAVESLRLDYEPKGVVFISIAGSQRGATAGTTADFIRTYGAHWTYLFDSDNGVFSRYGIEGTPTFFVVDRSGIVVTRQDGVVSTQGLESALEVALS